LAAALAYAFMPTKTAAPLLKTIFFIFKNPTNQSNRSRLCHRSVGPRTTCMPKHLAVFSGLFHHRHAHSKQPKGSGNPHCGNLLFCTKARCRFSFTLVGFSHQRTSASENYKKGTINIKRLFCRIGLRACCSPLLYYS